MASTLKPLYSHRTDAWSLLSFHHDEYSRTVNTPTPLAHATPSRFGAVIGDNQGQLAVLVVHQDIPVVLVEYQGQLAVLVEHQELSVVLTI